jgi:hypothetical protein
MKAYLEIFSDVVLLATFQPRWRERSSSAPRLGEFGQERNRAPIASSDLRFDQLTRI